MRRRIEMGEVVLTTYARFKHSVEVPDDVLQEGIGALNAWLEDHE